jgi:vacuolar-type H+-ATPase subunit I/STV1
MKKMITAVACFIVFSAYCFAQAYEGTIEYDKKKQGAIIITYPYSQEAVEGAFVQKFEGVGLNAKEERGLFNSSKGFRSYKSAIIRDISVTSLDYIFKVEQKGRKGSNEAILYLIVNKDGNNILSTRDEIVIATAKSYLNDMLPEVEAFNLELQIKDQDETVSKAEKKLKDLEDDQESMEKKIKKLQDDLKENAKNQQDQQKEIEKQRQILDAVNAKRKG